MDKFVIERLDRSKEYQMKSGASRNMQPQTAMERGLFAVRENARTPPDGSVRVTRTTKVTGKGQQYFTDKLLGNKVYLAQG